MTTLILVLLAFLAGITCIVWAAGILIIQRKLQPNNVRAWLAVAFWPVSLAGIFAWYWWEEHVQPRLLGALDWLTKLSPWS